MFSRADGKKRKLVGLFYFWNNGVEICLVGFKNDVLGKFLNLQENPINFLWKEKFYFLRKTRFKMLLSRLHGNLLYIDRNLFHIFFLYICNVHYNWLILNRFDWICLMSFISWYWIVFATLILIKRYLLKLRAFQLISPEFLWMLLITMSSVISKCWYNRTNSIIFLILALSLYWCVILLDYWRNPPTDSPHKN